MRSFSSQHPQRQRRRPVATTTWKQMRFVSISMAMIIVTTAILVGGATVTPAATESEEDVEDYYRVRRAASKPWLMKEFRLLELPEPVYHQVVGLVESQMGYGYTEYVPKQVFASPFTLLLIALVVANLWSWISYHLSGSWVEASHILVKDTSPKTLKALVGLRDTLGTDGKMFGLTAKEYSQCPSAAQNGNLGRFGPGVMAPPFDALCFDPDTPLNTTVGPIQTQFGYHLIYLRTRKY